MYHKPIVGGSTYYARSDYKNADLIIEWFTGGGTGGAARRGVEIVDTNLRSVSVEIIDLNNIQPLNQKRDLRPRYST